LHTHSADSQILPEIQVLFLSMLQMSLAETAAGQEAHLTYRQTLI